jgi:hypothetical protein
MDEKMKNYLAIRLWGENMGSYGYYISTQIEQAREDDAPDDAIYKGRDGVWKRLSEIENTDLRDTLMDKIKRNSNDLPI